MAKQKLKMPAKPVSPPGADGSSIIDHASKRKLKTPGKAKAKSTAEVVRSGGAKVKAKGKPRVGRRKLADPFAGVGVNLLPGEPKGAARARKIRPPASPGRLERLEIAIDEVRSGARASARTRKLLQAGVPKMAQKVIEEAAEVAIEAIRGERAALVNETVDLFYNLVALCSELGVPLSTIWAEMDRREQQLGMAEKLPKMSDL